MKASEITERVLVSYHDYASMYFPRRDTATELQSLSPEAFGGHLARESVRRNLPLLVNAPDLSVPAKDSEQGVTSR